MKKTVLLLVLPLLLGFSGFAQVQVSVLPKIGVNVVDIEKATGTLKYENATGGTYLNSWDLLNYGATIEISLQKNEKINYGGEITYNRLYYWEEAYSTFYGREYRWGNVGAIGLSALVRYNLTSIFYIKPAIGLEIYTGASGVTLGTALAAGMNLKLSDKITIPVEARTDQIFGNAISLLFGLGTGIRYSF